MQWAKQKQPGFTIVELLIVIVVIAILAAITIVAYNGIQDRVKNSAAQNAAAQTAKKLMAYAVLNNDQYPASLAQADIQNSDGSLQYTSNGTSFCVTATTQNVSYFQRNTTQAEKGACEGHGANGIAPIANVASNPSFESTLGANSFNATNSWGSGGGYSGSRYLRSTRANTSGASGPWMNAATVEEGKVYRVTIAARGNVNTTRDFNIEWINAAGTSMVSRVTIGAIIPTTNWTTFSGFATAPTGAGILRLAIYTTGSSTGTTTDYMDIDGIMVTETNIVRAFADGNSQGWAWTGAVNNSSSTGPPL